MLKYQIKMSNKQTKEPWRVKKAEEKLTRMAALTTLIRTSPAWNASPLQVAHQFFVKLAQQFAGKDLHICA